MLVGASMGGTASLVAAAQPRADVAAVITLSAPISIEGLTAGPEVLTQVRGAKLFIAGVGDPAGAAGSAQQLYDASPPPKRIDIEPSSGHGTDLLNGSEIVRNLVLTYLAQYGSAS